MDFKRQYLSLKREGETDEEIARKMYIGISTLKRYKKEYEIPTMKQAKKNQQGITEKELLFAESKGIPRDRVLRRLRCDGWEIEKAINTPVCVRKKRTSI
jgi:transposase